MFNQNLKSMKNLKLNQLNKQKMDERAMNAIEGGAAARPPIIEYPYSDACGERCAAGNDISRAGFSNGMKAFA